MKKLIKYNPNKFLEQKGMPSESEIRKLLSEEYGAMNISYAYWWYPLIINGNIVEYGNNKGDKHHKLRIFNSPIDMTTFSWYNQEQEWKISKNEFTKGFNFFHYMCIQIVYGKLKVENKLVLLYDKIEKAMQGFHPFSKDILIIWKNTLFNSVFLFSPHYSKGIKNRKLIDNAVEIMIKDK